MRPSPHRIPEALALATALALAGVVLAPLSARAVPAAPPVAGASISGAAPVGSGRRCRVLGAPLVAARSGCRYGLPVRVGRHLLVPKVCLIPMGKQAVLRHAVELYDVATGRRRGQASLPAAKAALRSSIPEAGALIGGEIPLYVWGGGIAAIHAASRRSMIVFEATGRVAGVAVAGQVLAVVDALPPDATFPKGSLEWTVLDFGAGALLGQARLAGRGLDRVGFEGRGRGLTATLGRRRGDAMQVLRAPVRGEGGALLPKHGLLKPKLSRLPWTRPARVAGAAGCPAVSESASVVVGRAPVSVTGAVVKVRSDVASLGRRLGGVPKGCAVATAPGAGGDAWAWVTGARRATLRHLRCK